MALFSKAAMLFLLSCRPTQETLAQVGGSSRAARDNEVKSSREAILERACECVISGHALYDLCRDCAYAPMERDARVPNRRRWTRGDVKSGGADSALRAVRPAPSQNSNKLLATDTRPQLWFAANKVENGGREALFNKAGVRLKFIPSHCECVKKLESRPGAIPHGGFPQRRITTFYIGGPSVVVLLFLLLFLMLMGCDGSWLSGRV